MSEDSRPRSRFDRGEPAPRSRFDRDRRSRSPSHRDSDRRRTRSPLARESTDSPSTVTGDHVKTPPVDPAAAAKAAAAAAAKINAQIQARKGIQQVEVPPIRQNSISSPPVARSPSTNPGPGTAVISEAFQQDGDHIQDIEINDLRNRYTLTKGAVQKKIKDETGADVTTRGEYYPDKTMATAANPPLYLRVTSTSKEGLGAAVTMINEMMKQDLPNLVDERRFRRREPEVERDEFGRRKWPEEKIPVDLEPITGFNLRAQVVGRGGDNVKYIQQETSCKVQIKGRGSGFMEPMTNQESDEPMYLHIAGPRPEGVQQAKQLCEELLEKVKTDYHAFKERPQQQRYSDGYGNGRPGHGDRGDRGRSDSYGAGGGYNSAGGYGGYSGQETSSPHPVQDATAAYGANGAAFDMNTHNAYVAYYQANPEQDPYRAYGGYSNYMQYYYAHMFQQQNSPAPAGANAPPPPPSEPANSASAVPPPPPPPAGSPGGYSAVPPPPGM